MNKYNKDLSAGVALEKLIYITKGKLAVFENIWVSFIDFLKKNVGNDQ